MKNLLVILIRFPMLAVILTGLVAPNGIFPFSRQYKPASQNLFVDTTADSNDPTFQVCSIFPNDCSLRGAISKANNALARSYIIYLPAGVYNLALPGVLEDQNAAGDLDIYADLTLTGAGQVSTQIDGNALDRVFHIHENANVTIRDLTLTNGRAPDNQALLEMSGGGLYNQGSVVLDGCSVTLSAAGTGAMDAVSGHGGGIYNQSELIILNDSRITYNQAGNGRDSTDISSPGGHGGAGGGIYNAGTLQIDGGSVSDNMAGEGGSGKDIEHVSTSSGGDGGSGGGIYNYGSLILLSVDVAGNSSGGGGQGGNCWLFPSISYPDQGCIGGAGGAGGHGGGIYNGGGLTLIETNIVANLAGNGGQGGAASSIVGPNGGQGGQGGGIYSTGPLSISHSQILGNLAGNGGGGGLGDYCSGGGGKGGDGGGVFSTGDITIGGSLIQSNISGQGSSGGEGGAGGGLYLDVSVNASLYGSQVSQNISGNGSAGSFCKSYYPTGVSGGDGGGIYNRADLLLDDTLVSDNNTGISAPTSDGALGGGIYNAGVLTANSSRVFNNRAGDGGRLDYYGYPDDNNPGGGGHGGGIYNDTDGILNLISSVIAGNHAGDGGPLIGSVDPANRSGPGGHGGGIFNQGDLQMDHSRVEDNHSGDSGARVEGIGLGNVGGSGGGLYNQGGLSLEFTTVFSNTTGAGGPDQACGDGGGLYSNTAPSLNGVTVIGNQTGDSDVGCSGAGLFLATSSTFSVSNLLVADNRLSSLGQGSGVYARSAAIDFWHTTLARNQGGDGSGIYALGVTLALTNTVLVSQTIGVKALPGSIVMMDTTLWGQGIWSNDLDYGGGGLVFDNHPVYGLPDFVAPDLGDYHIGPASTARDQGIDSRISADLDDQPRPDTLGGFPDIGADEYWDLIPLTDMAIDGPATGHALTRLTFSAVITPANATPNVYFFWTPLPANGQGTGMATYTWLEPGTETITVTAQNAGSSVVAGKTIEIGLAPFRIFIPNIWAE